MSKLSYKSYLGIGVLLILMVLAAYWGRHHYKSLTFIYSPLKPLQQDEAALPILIYHHFSEEKINENALVMGRENFRKQIKYLKDHGYQSVSMKQLVDFVERGIDLPEKPVLITIDDGYESNYTIAYPILKEFETKATIFMIGHAVGSSTYKETGAPLSPYFSLEQGREMIDSGLIEIQSHSMDMHQVEAYEHYRNNKEIRISAVKKDFDTEESFINYFNQDTEQSKKQITEDFGQEWLAYSYPLGHHDDLTERLLTEHQTKITLIVEEGLNILKKKDPQSLRKLKRFFVSDKTSELDLKAMLRLPTRKK